MDVVPVSVKVSDLKSGDCFRPVESIAEVGCPVFIRTNRGDARNYQCVTLSTGELYFLPCDMQVYPLEYRIQGAWMEVGKENRSGMEREKEFKAALSKRGQLEIRECALKRTISVHEEQIRQHNEVIALCQQQLELLGQMREELNRIIDRPV